MEKNAKFYIAGHNGMVGSAILRNLESKGYRNFVFTPYPEYDLTDQSTVRDFFLLEKPDYVIDAAAKVGGILANSIYRAQFIYENMMIQNNLIHNAHLSKVKKLLFLGSSCIYPRECQQPIKEEYLLTGLLETTNEPYAIAKIAGIKMCENYYHQYDSNFISVMPTNLYGPGDNYDLKNSHVIPALIRKFHDAKMVKSPTVEIWGSGKPLREFLHVDDMADACVHIMESVEAKELYGDYQLNHINIGTGKDIAIADLAVLIGNVVGFEGTLVFDASKPDGAPRKLLDVSRLHNMGWRQKLTLEDGIGQTYDWFLKANSVRK